MNKKELVNSVASEAGISKAEASRVVDALIRVVTKALKKNERVLLVGFGAFSIRKRAARQGRNPMTGAAIKIAAAKTPAFKSGRALRDAVGGDTDDPGPSISTSVKKSK